LILLVVVLILIKYDGVYTLGYLVSFVFCFLLLVSIKAPQLNFIHLHFFILFEKTFYYFNFTSLFIEIYLRVQDLKISIYSFIFLSLTCTSPTKATKNLFLKVTFEFKLLKDFGSGICFVYFMFYFLII
jgi:hypothetical protein